MTLDDQITSLTKGCVDVIRESELRERLERSAATSTPLVIKVGFDPTAPDLHLGHTVVIRKMKHFQDLGHRVVFVIGDFTGLIGDPTFGPLQRRKQRGGDHARGDWTIVDDARIGSGFLVQKFADKVDIGEWCLGIRTV